MNAVPWTQDEAQEGRALPEVVVDGLSRTDLVRYAGASGDFNPIHHDDEFAKAAGNPSVFGHGMLTAGVLAKAITDVVGAEGLRRYRVRFVSRVWPGDTITCGGIVTRRYEADGEHRIDGEVSARTQRGEVVVTGTFTAALPAGR